MHACQRKREGKKPRPSSILSLTLCTSSSLLLLYLWFVSIYLSIYRSYSPPSFVTTSLSAWYLRISYNAMGILIPRCSVSYGECRPPFFKRSFNRVIITGPQMNPWKWLIETLSAPFAPFSVNVLVSRYIAIIILFYSFIYFILFLQKLTCFTPAKRTRTHIRTRARVITLFCYFLTYIY